MRTIEVRKRYEVGDTCDNCPHLAENHRFCLVFHKKFEEVALPLCQKAEVKECEHIVGVVSGGSQSMGFVSAADEENCPDLERFNYCPNCGTYVGGEDGVEMRKVEDE